MLLVEIDEENGIAILPPDGSLPQTDFETASRAIDPYIEQAGQLNGLIIRTKSFPGWDSFSTLVKPLRFVKNHHRKIARIAFVTDTAVTAIANKVAKHFVSAQIEKFSYQEREQARYWIVHKGFT